MRTMGVDRPRHVPVAQHLHENHMLVGGRFKLRSQAHGKHQRAMHSITVLLDCLHQQAVTAGFNQMSMKEFVRQGPSFEVFRLECARHFASRIDQALNL